MLNVRMRGQAWLDLALVACHKGVTKANVLRDLAKSQFELRDVRQGLDVIVSSPKLLDLEKRLDSLSIA
jgi:hypothetical protein